MRTSVRSFRLGQVAPRAGVNIGMGVVQVVGRGKLGVRAQVGRLARIGRHRAVPGRAGRMRAALAASLPRDFDRARILARSQPRVLARILRGELRRAGQDQRATCNRQPSLAHRCYSLSPLVLSVRNMAMASISTSSSGRQRCAWMPVEAGSGSSPCSLKKAVRPALKTS